VAKSNRETVPLTWSSDSEGAIAEMSASVLNEEEEEFIFRTKTKHKDE